MKILRVCVGVVSISGKNVKPLAVVRLRFTNFFQASLLASLGLYVFVITGQSQLLINLWSGYNQLNSKYMSFKPFKRQN